MIRMNKKAYKWLVMLVAFVVLCAVGKYLKSQYDRQLNLDDFVPVDFSATDVDAVAEKVQNERETVVIKINLNTASAEQLCELEDIGESTAQRIIDFRNDYGGFKNIEEIKLVDGIGEKTYLKISKYLTVE